MSQAVVELDAKQWKEFFAKSRDNLKDLAKILSIAAGAFVFQDIDDHFRAESGPDGAWAPRREPYKSRMERAGYTKLLQVTGNLRQSILPTNIQRVSDDTISIFANAPYSGGLDEGTDNIKARPFMWASDEVQGKMLELVLELASGEKDV